MKRSEFSHIEIPEEPNRENVPDIKSAGTANGNETDSEGKEPAENWFLLMRLCLYFGWMGAHRFYTGKYATGILWLLTFGLFGFGWLFDLARVLCGRFKGRNGEFIRRSPWPGLHGLLWH